MCMDTYPLDTKMFNDVFIDDASCLEYLVKIRWPDGYVCPDCQAHGQAWLLGKGKIKCRKCRHVHSALSGTVFQDSHTPLLTWFRIMWHICLQKNGYSALSLQRSLGFSYPTAWLCLHKLRKAMVRPGREKLSGVVEVDEAYVGGKCEGRHGRGAFGKNIVMVAAERKKSGNGRPVIGRARLLVIPDVTAGTLADAVGELAEKGATIVTDAWRGYAKLPEKDFTHVVSRQGRKTADTPFDSECMIEEDSPLPNCHRVISLLKRWILGTLQGSVGKEHMQDYLNEFVFRFNRRSSKARGMLFWRLMQIAVDCAPTTRRSIINTHI